MEGTRAAGTGSAGRQSGVDQQGGAGRQGRVDQPGGAGQGRVGKGPAPARTPSTARNRRAVTRRFFPPQHGAWAMLLVPYLAALLVTGWRWPDAPLLGAWLAGYLLSYQSFQALKARRPARYRTPALFWAAIAAPLAAVVVLARPVVLLTAPAFAALVAVNAWYAWRRRDRALANDLVSVAQSCLVMVVVALIAGAAPGAVLAPAILVAAYFAGTVLFVKTMIRERRSTGYRVASVAYHAVAFAVAAWYGPWTGILFALLLVRAAALPGRRLSPALIGVLEIVNSVLVLVAVALTWH